MARRNRARGTALSLPGQPNDLWCADYKGEFMLADRRYCYPLEEDWDDPLLGLAAREPEHLAIIDRPPRPCPPNAPVPDVETRSPQRYERRSRD
jgi:hypothetical protein